MRAQVHAQARTAAARVARPPVKMPTRNDAVRNILRGNVQPKLRVGAVNDPAEREADQVADRVMRMAAPVEADTPPQPLQDTVRRLCSECEQEQAQRKPADGNATSTSMQDPTIRRIESELTSDYPCAKSVFGGEVMFSALPQVMLDDIAVINEADGGGLTSPVSNGVWYDCDGLWFRPESQWYKIPDHCAVEVTDLTPARLTGLRCCNLTASLLKAGPRWSSDGLDESKQNPFLPVGETETVSRSARARSSGASFEPTAEATAKIRSLGSGVPLPKAERTFFEPRLGQDLSTVRVHSDENANAASNSIHARAFTLGADIAFAKGEYRPGTTGGRHLLAHELVHVGQEKQAGSDKARSALTGNSLSVKNEHLSADVYRADRDAVSRVGALARTVGSGIQFFPTNIVDTQVGPVSVRGGLMSRGASRLNVILGSGITPRILARELLPLWTTATPFTPAGAAVANPLDVIDEDILARGLMVYNRYYLGLPTMTKWRSGIRLPLPVELDEVTGDATLNPTQLRHLAGSFDPAWAPLLETGASVTTVPAPADTAAAVTAFLSEQATASARGAHLAVRVISNATAERHFVAEVFRRTGAASFDIALRLMDTLVNRDIALLAVQDDGAVIIAAIRGALGLAPGTLSTVQQSSLTRANLMLGLVAGTASLAGPAAVRSQPEKTVSVDTLKLGGSNHNPATQIAIANAIYAQCNVRFTHGVNATATAGQTTTWLAGNTDLRSGNNCAAPSTEERNVFRDGSAAHGLGTARFSAFFAATASGISASGYSCRAGLGPAPLFRNKIVVLNSGSTDTLAHELGHHLIDSGAHSPADSIMAGRPRPTLRITDTQCGRIYGNA